jgi:hypothetical protein
VNEICLKKLLLTGETVLVWGMKSAVFVIKRNSSTPKMLQLQVILALGS